MYTRVIAVLAVLVSACRADPATTESSPAGKSHSSAPTEPGESEPTTEVFDPDEPTLPGGVRVLSQATDDFVEVDGGRYGVRVSDSLLYQVDLPDGSEVFRGTYLNPGSSDTGRNGIFYVEGPTRTPCFR
ncbi:MAG: hypothetical protein H0V07_11660 [Propionibacteriales bacterium]|nr:hypothetical protein [Propionibacteriales bacterium]